MIEIIIHYHNTDYMFFLVNLINIADDIQSILMDHTITVCNSKSDSQTNATLFRFTSFSWLGSSLVALSTTLLPHAVPLR